MSAVDRLRAVLCAPDGTVSIDGSEADRAIVAEALLELSARPLPSDWLAVPREPTLAMLEAAFDRTGPYPSLTDYWNAMLAAAPSAPAEVREMRVWQCPDCPTSVEYDGKSSPPCPRCDASMALDPTAKTAPDPLAQGDLHSTHHVHRGPESLPCYCAATADHLIGEEVSKGEALARRFHEAYERLAPSFGYETRTETRQFDPTTPNGRLMIAVCEEIAIESALTTAAGGGGLRELPSTWRKRAERKRIMGLTNEAMLDEAHANELEAALGRGGRG